MPITRTGKIAKSTDKTDTVRPAVKQTKKPVRKTVKKATVKKPRAKAMAYKDDDEGPVYFWKETDPMVGYLSQWYYCPFKDDKDPQKTYKTAEQ